MSHPYGEPEGPQAASIVWREDDSYDGPSAWAGPAAFGNPAPESDEHPGDERSSQHEVAHDAPHRQSMGEAFGSWGAAAGAAHDDVASMHRDASGQDSADRGGEAMQRDDQRFEDQPHRQGISLDKQQSDDDVEPQWSQPAPDQGWQSSDDQGWQQSSDDQGWQSSDDQGWQQSSDNQFQDDDRSGWSAPPPEQPTTIASIPADDPQPQSSDDALTIGRSRDNSIVLDDMLVSRHHVRITADNDGLLLEDLGSRNGTFVNGRRVDQAHLHEGDRLGIGSAVFEVRDGWLVTL